MQFSSKENNGTKEYHKWHKLELKRDFEHQLMKYKRLPLDSLAQKQKIMKQIKNYKEQEKQDEYSPIVSERNSGKQITHKAMTESFEVPEL